MVHIQEDLLLYEICSYLQLNGVMKLTQLDKEHKKLIIDRYILDTNKICTTANLTMNNDYKRMDKLNIWMKTYHNLFLNYNMTGDMPSIMVTLLSQLDEEITFNVVKTYVSNNNFKVDITEALCESMRNKNYKISRFLINNCKILQEGDMYSDCPIDLAIEHNLNDVLYKLIYDKNIASEIKEYVNNDPIQWNNVKKYFKLIIRNDNHVGFKHLYDRFHNIFEKHSLEYMYEQIQNNNAFKVAKALIKKNTNHMCNIFQEYCEEGYFTGIKFLINAGIDYCIDMIKIIEIICEKEYSTILQFILDHESEKKDLGLLKSVAIINVLQNTIINNYLFIAHTILDYDIIINIDLSSECIEYIMENDIHKLFIRMVDKGLDIKQNNNILLKRALHHNNYNMITYLLDKIDLTCGDFILLRNRWIDNIQNNGSLTLYNDEYKIYKLLDGYITNHILKNNYNDFIINN
jgi:hypothetical protein